jgi:hypothetical protein
MAILKRVLFGDGTNLFAPTVAREGGRKVADFPVSTSQNLQPTNQNGEP